jgi:copper(I)-binding protein
MRHERSLAVFMALSNPEGPDDALLAVEHAATRRIALHDARIGHDDLTAGRGFPLAVGKGASHSLAPGQLHLMMLDLPEVPDPGERVELQFHFARAGALIATCFVHSPG